VRSSIFTVTWFFVTDSAIKVAKSIKKFGIKANPSITAHLAAETARVKISALERMEVLPIANATY
jgi:hypothetical protein